MKSRFGRFVLVATLAMGAGAFASDKAYPPQPGHSVIHHSPMPYRPNVASPTQHEEVWLHSRRSALSGQGHCLPGVYRTEVLRFRGEGFVARNRTSLTDQVAMQRAGDPHMVSHLARRSNGFHDTGYYIGGGASLFKGPGFARRANDGTWGWDYEHLGVKRRVKLLISRGGLYQDGDGQYQPDPPFEITNVFAIRYGERLYQLLGHRGE